MVVMLLQMCIRDRYNTFRKTQGIPRATTFCTNHVRQMGIFFAKAVRHRNWDHVGRLLCHLSRLVLFVLGGVIATVLCRLFLEVYKRQDEGLPAEYSFSDEEKLPALGMVEEKEGTVCTVETDSETETESYVYTGLASGGAAAKEYVNQMMEEHDCAVVDEQGTKQQEPAFTEESGSVILGKNSQDETGMLQLKVEGSKDSCTVTPALVEGLSLIHI